MKKLLSILLALSLVATFAACSAAPAEPAATEEASQATEEPAAEEEAAESGEAVQIIWGSGPLENDSKAMIIEAFNSSQDAIELVGVELSADATEQHNTYVTSFSGNSNDYDIFTSNVPWPGEFSQAGYAMALDRYIERDGIDMSQYVPGYVDSYTFQGQLWGIPTFGNVPLLYYRTDIVETAPTTWEELLSMAQEYQGTNDTTYGYLIQAAQYEGLTCNTVDMIAAYGGEVLDGDGVPVIDSEGTIAALDIMQQFVTSGILPDDVTTHKEANSTELFLAGDAVFMRNWPSAWRDMTDPEKSSVVDMVAYTPLPSGSERSAGTLGGWGTMIYANTLHPDEAWEAVKFIAGTEGQKIFAVEGASLPTLLPLYEDADVLEANPMFADNMAQAMSDAVKRPVTPIYTEISEIIQIETTNVLLGSTTPADAAANMQTQMQEAIDSNT